MFMGADREMTLATVMGRVMKIVASEPKTKKSVECSEELAADICNSS
jgi:hypothetical protein